MTSYCHCADLYIYCVCRGASQLRVFDSGKLSTYKYLQRRQNVFFAIFSKLLKIIFKYVVDLGMGLKRSEKSKFVVENQGNLAIILQKI